MFTGLVEARGRLAGRMARGPGARLSIQCPFRPLVYGESIAVDGVCLTVETITPTGFEADASAETLATTTLGRLPVGAGVNLERALPAGGRLGGHIMSGHVDGVGKVVEKRPLGDAISVTFSMPAELARFVAQKGSIAVNGTSLTVNVAGRDRFSVVLIPATQEVTALHDLHVGSEVNLEVDVLARYLARLLEMGAAPAPSAAPPDGAQSPGNQSSLSASGDSEGSSDAAWKARLRNAGYL